MMNYIGIDGRIYNDELYHHGVIGMKWGIRKDRARSARRSLNKLASLEKKQQKYQLKAAKYQIKSAKRQKKIAKYAKSGVPNQKKYTSTQMETAKYTTKAAKYTKKAAKTNKKAIKFANKMSQIYGDTLVSELNSKQIYAGRKYCVRLVG